MDAADLKLGHRVYNKNGKLMAIDLNRQVDILNRQDAANWLTPATVQIQRTDMQKRIDYRASIGRKYVPGSLEEQMQQHGKDSINGTHPPSRPNLSEQTLGQAVSVAHGLPAPANPSTDGNRQKLWPTITAHTPDMESSGPNGNSGTYLAGAVKQWATPQSRDAKGAEGRMIRDGQSTDLPSQTEVAPTGQWNRVNGKLNPRWVETLMGLPVGWTMPSCKSPVTIELTNYDCSETESCQQQQNEHSELF